MIGGDGGCLQATRAKESQIIDATLKSLAPAGCVFTLRVATTWLFEVAITVPPVQANKQATTPNGGGEARPTSTVEQACTEGVHSDKIAHMQARLEEVEKVRSDVRL